MSRVAIIDYGMGNVASVKKALDFLEIKNFITRDYKKINASSHIILPGVGAYGSAMKALNKYGLKNLLSELVISKKRKILGICLGMQLFSDMGMEYGQNPGLGFIAGKTIKLKYGKFRLPHIGWNNVEIAKDDVLFRNVNDKNFYFVHSYHFKPKNNNVITSICDYGEKFVASMRKDNIFAVQFHPEKSQKSGLEVLKNFISYA